MQQSIYPQPPFGALRRVASRLRTTLSLIALGVTTLLTLALSSPAAHAQDYNENVLYNFTGTSDGGGPFAGLINVNGTFYGTTSYGSGTSQGGTIFSFNPTTHATTTLYSFKGNSVGDGFLPQAGLTYDSGTGKLYGTTVTGGTGSGGSYGSDGAGTIFSINPDGTGYQSLYSFTGADHSNGADPQASMTDVNGTLYGTTARGGTPDAGTVFSFNASTHVFQTLHSLGADPNAGDGGYPTTDLTYDSTSGKLFGTTEYSPGGNSNGTIFSIKPDGTGYQTLYVFGSNPSNPTDGSDPRSGLTEVNGIFYGNTVSGGNSTNADASGTVFSFDPNTNTETTLYSFQGETSGDGRYPTGDLTYDSSSGRLFGSTYQGGDANNDGFVFSIKPDGTGYHIVYRFQGYFANDGSDPYTASLLDVSGTLYGTTTDGGSANSGSIFSLTATTFTLPKVGNDKYTVRYNNTFAIKAPGVMANDNVGGSNRTTATLVTNVTHGTLTFNADGSFTYAPNTGFVGNDTFTYYDTNPAGKSNTGTVTLAVTAEVPIAYNDGYGPKYNTTYSVRNPGVLANDYTGENVTLTATLVTSASHGTLSFHSDGSFVYKPTLGYSGTDSFTYYATNPIGNSNTATVSLIVSPTNPIAYNDTYTVKYQTAFAVQKPGVLANDDTGGVTPMTAVLNSNPSNGTLTFNTDGSFTYKPNAGFTGTDSFTYFASTSVGTSTNPATVTLNVPKTVPIAANDTYSVKHNTAFHVNAPGVLGNDGTGGSTPLTAALVTGPTHGTLTFNSDGSFTYTPTTGYSGADSFTYTASNSVGTSNTATVTLNVQ